ncbi:hypothetical protein ACHAWX_004284 [Stephanocyclus meneghinianus]
MTVLVVGSGVIGLRTAIELIRKKHRICLLSPRHPLHPSTCSVGAGGLWMPFHCDDERTDRWAFDTLDELMSYTCSRESDSSGSDVVGASKALVEIVPAISFKHKTSKNPPEWATDRRSHRLKFLCLTIDDLYKESLSQNFRLPRREVMDDAGYSHSWLFHPPIVDSPNMLMNMVRELESSEYTEHINLNTEKDYANVQELVDEAINFGCDSLVNCTGLGSKPICGDESLIGARGVLLQFDRPSCKWNDQPERNDSVIMVEDPPLGTDTEPCYMIPRGNIIAVGGTYLEGDEEEEIRPKEILKIMENARLMGINTDRSKPISQWVGFRPYRPRARLEVDDEFSKSGVKVVHSFGYGGSGWTVFVGAAKEAASLLLSS